MPIPDERAFAYGFVATLQPDANFGRIGKTGNEGVIKLIADADRDGLVGATSPPARPAARCSACLLWRSTRSSRSRSSAVIYAYPTFHEAVEDAVRALRRPRR